MSVEFAIQPLLPLVGSARLPEGQGDAEVEHLDASVVGQHHVLGFEIPMDQAHGVRVRECPHHRQRDLDRPARDASAVDPRDRQQRVLVADELLLDPGAQGDALHVLQNHERVAARLADLVDVENVLVLAAGCRSGLGQECLGQIGPLGSQEFDGHPAAQTGVAGQIHDSHAAAPELADELVLGKHGSRAQCVPVLGRGRSRGRGRGRGIARGFRARQTKHGGRLGPGLAGGVRTRWLGVPQGQLIGRRPTISGRRIGGTTHDTPGSRRARTPSYSAREVRIQWHYPRTPVAAHEACPDAVARGRISLPGDRRLGYGSSTVLRISLLLIVASCHAADDRSQRVAEGPGQTAAPASQKPGASRPAPAKRALTPAQEAEARDFIARYRRGEAVVRTEVPTVIFISPRGDGCRAMPATRPEGFEIIVEVVGYEPDSAITYGISANACHFDWPNFHLPPPPASCAVPAESTLDELFDRLRSLDVHRWRSTELREVSPHRGGRSLTVRWPGAECRTSDIGSSEVRAADRARFDQAIDHALQVYRQNAPSPAVTP